MKKMLGIGNALVDILIRIEDDALLGDLDLPKGSMILVDKERADRILQKTRDFAARKSSGGSAANAIHGLARLGVPCGFFGTIGDDAHGDFFKSDLQANAIDPHLVKLPHDTGKSIALISRDAERTFATFLGAAAEIHARTVSADWLRQYHTLHIEGYLLPNRDLSEKIFQLAADNGVRVSLDFSSYNVVEENREYLENVLRDHVDIALANEEEARMFTGGSPPEKAVEEIARLCEVSVVKCGAEGSWVQRRAEKVYIPPIQVNAVDTTGAGDLFAAGFLYGLLRELPLDLCGKVGSILGGKVVEVIGAKMRDDDWTKILDQLRDELPQIGAG